MPGNHLHSSDNDLPVGSIDDFIRRVQEDELVDRVSAQTKATPIDYARLRSRTTKKHIAPQKIYYAIRNGRIELEDCVCKRHVIDIAKADKYFGYHQEPKDENNDETEVDT